MKDDISEGFLLLRPSSGCATVINNLSQKSYYIQLLFVFFFWGGGSIFYSTGRYEPYISASRKSTSKSNKTPLRFIRVFSPLLLLYYFSAVSAFKTIQSNTFSSTFLCTLPNTFHSISRFIPFACFSHGHSTIINNLVKSLPVPFSVMTRIWILKAVVFFFSLLSSK